MTKITIKPSKKDYVLATLYAALDDYGVTYIMPNLDNYGIEYDRNIDLGDFNGVFSLVKHTNDSEDSVIAEFDLSILWSTASDLLKRGTYIFSDIADKMLDCIKKDLEK